MRYFMTLAYRGTRYCGWQSQPNGISVQATLEKVLQTVLREPVSITGCGRTDTGVHARYYVAHFDAASDLPASLLHRLNGMLPPDIAVYAIQPMQEQAHARYDAYERSYAYYIALRKDPFQTETAWFFSQHPLLDRGKMQAVANLLPHYSAFFPFCKTHSGLHNYQCDLRSAVWVDEPEQQQIVLHITANRFLRGMVRLIVGACLQAGLGKLSVSDVQLALEKQIPLKKNWTVPPQGLFLVDVKYSYFDVNEVPPALFNEGF